MSRPGTLNLLLAGAIMVQLAGCAAPGAAWPSLLVIGGTTPTAPSPVSGTHEASIRFSADRSYIKVGMPVVFSWNVPGATAVYFHAEGERWQEAAVPARGKATVAPMAETTYVLRAVFLDGTVTTRKITIPVEPAPGL